MIEIRHKPIKRIFDILFSLLILMIAFPVFFILALLVRLSSPGKTFYSHERIGRGGQPFYCYKFRTMYVDADKRLNDILNQDGVLKEEWETTYKLKNDPRITPIGKILRKTSLDELPQLWNILKGDLSVVGPRPVVREELIKYFGKKADLILSIRPGLTGLWQVSGRSNTSYDYRISLDEEYVKNQSLFLDLKLIAKTLPAIFSSRGAY